MKKILLLLTFLSSATFSLAQKQFVEVSYQMTMDMDAEQVIGQIPSQYRAAVEDQIRQELADGIFIDYVLKTNGNESVYKIVEQINNAQTQGGMIAQQMRTFDKGTTYKNLAETFYMKPVDLPGQRYMLRDSLQDFKWKITREKEDIAGFSARKATGEMVMNDSITTVTAWYAPKINIKDGPSSIWGLPGLILKAQFFANGAELTLTATHIVVKEKEIKIEKPTGGKEVTQKEFETEMKILQEKYKEMMGGGVDTE